MKTGPIPKWKLSKVVQAGWVQPPPTALTYQPAKVAFRLRLTLLTYYLSRVCVARVVRVHGRIGASDWLHCVNGLAPFSASS